MKTSFIKTIFLSLLCVILVSCGTSGTPTAQNEGYNVFNGTENALSFEHPADWVVHEGLMGTLAMVQSPLESENDDISENISFITQDIAQMGVDDFTKYIEVNLEQLESFLTDYTLVAREDVTVGEFSGEKLVYEFSQGTMKLHTTQYILDTSKEAFIITITNSQDAPDKYEGEFMKIIESVEI